MSKSADVIAKGREVTQRLLWRATHLSLRATLLLVLPLLVAVVASVIYLLGGRYISTDNAYIGQQRVLITPEVSGKVASISVVEGQQLKPGDVLFAIDPAPYAFAEQKHARSSRKSAPSSRI